MSREYVYAFLLNALVCAGFFLVPSELRDRVLASVEVSISDFRLPEVKVDEAEEVVSERDKDASEAVSGDSSGGETSGGRGAAKSGTGSGGGGSSETRILSEALTDFKAQSMGDSLKSGPSISGKNSEVANIMREMEFYKGMNSVTAPKGGGGGGSDGNGGQALSASFKGRMGKAGRSGALKKYGGDVHTENAVDRALRYLASKQNRPGSWGSSESISSGDMVALSSFAMLAFLSHGETFDSELYGKTVKNGTEFLIKLAETPGIENAGRGFGHAILTYALAETYAMTGNLALKKPLEERVKAITARQNKLGSFADNYDNAPQSAPPASESNDPRSREIIAGEPSCDLSLLGWHIQALTAAKNAGVKVDGLDKSLEFALEALVRIHQAKQGGFSQGINMRRFDAQESMNGVGLLGLQLLNAGSSSAAKRAERIIVPQREKDFVLPKWKDAKGIELYRWYYQTQCIFQSEKGNGKDWEAWNENMKKELTASQLGEGNWMLPPGDRSYRLRNREDLSIYATSVSALILQVYYRYLPSYSIAENTGKSSGAADTLEKGIGGYITRLPGGADPMADVIFGTGSAEMKKVTFGAFDSAIRSVETPHNAERFKTYATFASTISVRDAKDWPQTLQPNQRIAIFLDEFTPENFKGNLCLTMATLGMESIDPAQKSAVEVVVNGQRLYYSYLTTQKNLVRIFIPFMYLQPVGNVIQVRNTGETPVAFDGAELGAVAKIGRRLYLACENIEKLPDSMRMNFNVGVVTVEKDFNPKQIKEKIRLVRQNSARPLLSVKEDIEIDGFRKLVAEFASKDTLWELNGTTERNDAFAGIIRGLDADAEIVFAEKKSDTNFTSASFQLPAYDEYRQVLNSTGQKEAYSPEGNYWAKWGAYGSEEMGEEFQRYYLTRTGREIAEWLNGGGSAVWINNIMDGGKLYDSVFKSEYPAAAALKQVSKLFDGNPRQIPLQIYPTHGDKPLLFTTAAASCNAPGVVTIVVGKRFASGDTLTLHTLVPWSGSTKMTIEKGFFQPDSPYAEKYGKIEKNESEINIDNGAFRHEGMFPEMTVIRLTQKFASEPQKPKLSESYRETEIRPDVSTAKVTGPAMPEKHTAAKLRDSKGFASTSGKNASFQVIPATESTEKGKNTFKPAEAESLEAVFAIKPAAKRYDSVFMLCGQGVENADALSLNVYPKCTFTNKKYEKNSVPMIFEFSGNIFQIMLQTEKWQRVTVPLSENIKAPIWGHVRVLEPRAVLSGELSSVSYEINNIVLLKKD